jgi:hypothetical protein
MFDEDWEYDADDYEICLYPAEGVSFEEWFSEIDAQVRDWTGYLAAAFAVTPTTEDWTEWPEEPVEAATQVLRLDAWGQLRLAELGLE